MNAHGEKGRGNDLSLMRIKTGTKKQAFKRKFVALFKRVFAEWPVTWQLVFYPSVFVAKWSLYTWIKSDDVVKCEPLRSRTHIHLFEWVY